jgi:RimJ/RimL family protein N-acetyltransferase
MEIFLETDRLVLRRFTGTDADHLHELDSDPEVMRYLSNATPTPYEVVRDEVLPRMLAEYRRSPGHGHWAAIERSTGAFLGWFGLQPAVGRPSDEAELAYRLRRSSWGRGYATEGARALVHKAFAELGLRRVYAETMAINVASRRVMEKAGLRHVRTFHPEFDDPIPGTEEGEVEYALTREEWERTRRPRRP